MAAFPVSTDAHAADRIAFAIRGMIKAAKEVVKDGPESNKVAGLKHFCEQLREDLGDKPAEHEDIGVVQEELKNHAEFGDPKVFKAMTDCLPDMVELLEDIEFQRRVEFLIEKYELSGQCLFSVTLDKEGRTSSVRDLSIRTALTDAETRSIKEFATIDRGFTDQHAYTLELTTEDGSTNVVKSFQLPVVRSQPDLSSWFLSTLLS